jgi:hypothetical protein
MQIHQSIRKRKCVSLLKKLIFIIIFNALVWIIEKLRSFCCSTCSYEPEKVIIHPQMYGIETLALIILSTLILLLHSPQDFFSSTIDTQNARTGYSTYQAYDATTVGLPMR